MAERQHQTELSIRSLANMFALRHASIPRSSDRHGDATGSVRFRPSGGGEKEILDCAASSGLTDIEANQRSGREAHDILPPDFAACGERPSVCCLKRPTTLADPLSRPTGHIRGIEFVGVVVVNFVDIQNF